MTSESQKISSKKYRQSEKGKITIQRYRKSIKGQDTIKRLRKVNNKKYYEPSRNKYAINNTIKRLWSDEEIKLILEKKYPDKEISNMIHRSISAIEIKRAKIKKAKIELQKKTKCICQSEDTLLTELNKTTLELYLEKDKLIGFCGWCACRSVVKIKYCPLCR